MPKQSKKYLKSIFKKRIIKEEKILKAIKRAHKKENNLLNKLLDENCDRDYIIKRITKTMQQEIEKGINKLFPNQKIYFDIPITEEIVKSCELEDDIFVDSLKKRRYSSLNSKVNSDYNFNQDYVNDNKEITEEGIELFINEFRNIIENNEEKPETDYWIVNALSGYKNDINRIPNYSTSLCYVKNNEIYFSAVFDWYQKDVYHAIKGHGAFLNNRKIRVSQNKNLDDTIISFRIGSKGLNDNVELQKAITPLTLKIQSFTNVAIEMCFVACGKIDGCIDVAVTDILDYKIGKLIVTEAGGLVTNFAGEDFKDSSNILATNGYIHSSMQKIVKSKLLSSTIKKVFKISKSALKFFLALA